MILDFSAPVLLQKILQIMQNPRAPKRSALIYAALSLAVRFIAAQSAVFSLWFARRAYERSRGELITMLYEKALSRKVVTVSSTVEEDEDECEDHDEDADPALNGNGFAKHEPKAALSRAYEFMSKLFRSKKAPVQVKMDKKAQWAASMGKIYNLLR